MSVLNDSFIKGHMSGTCKSKLPFQITIFNYKPASVVTTIVKMPMSEFIVEKMAIVPCQEDSTLRLNILAANIRKKTFLRIRVGYP